MNYRGTPGESRPERHQFHQIERNLAEKRSLSDHIIHADELMRKEVTRAELIDLVKLDE